MLRSTAIVRAVPSVGSNALPSSRLLSSRTTTASLSRNGRQFGTARRRTGAGFPASTPFTIRYTPVPVAVGGLSSASSSRAFSLWGYGKKKPLEEPTTAPEAIAEPLQPIQPNPDAAAASPQIAATSRPPPTEPAVTATDIDMSSISEFINDQDILNMPEQLGYLRDMGLDYGWGPTSVMQWVLEHMHVWSGMGWAGSIIATAVLMRVIMFYPQVQSLKFSADMAKMRKDPRMEESMRLLRTSIENKDPAMRQRGTVIGKELRKEYGVTGVGWLWAFVQIPFTFGLFRIVSGMTHIPLPSLETSGFLWFYDLTATDPYFLLPALGTGFMLLSIKLNSKYSTPEQQKMMKTMSWVFGLVGFVTTTFFSAAINLMTVAVGASSAIQSLILSIPAVRRSFGLSATPPAPKTTTATVLPPKPREPGIEGLRQQLTSNLNEMKKGFSAQVGNMTGQQQLTDEEKAAKQRKETLRKMEDKRRQQEREAFESKYKGKKR